MASGSARTGSAARLRLSVAGLSKSFGGVQALDKITIAFPSTGVVALIGPNGAGKTTLFNILSGFIAPDAGECHIEGRRTTGMPPHLIARLGLARTFQQVRLVRQLSVLENLCLARPRQTGERFLAALMGARGGSTESGNRDFARPLLERLHLLEQEDMPAGSLSYGQQKLLSLGCCLAMEATILLLDEPLTGVHPALALAILELIAEVGRSGNLVVFIEHDLEAVSKVADEAIIIHRGTVLARGVLADVLKLPEVLEAYVG
jgi:neutral amino acid transport system ATP-binding protein